MSGRARLFVELWHALGLDRDSRSRSRRRTKLPVFFLLLESFRDRTSHSPCQLRGLWFQLRRRSPSPRRHHRRPRSPATPPRFRSPRSSPAGRRRHPHRRSPDRGHPRSPDRGRPRSPDRGRPRSPDRGRPRSPDRGRPRSHHSPPVLSAQRIQEINNERARRGLAARRPAQLRRNARRPPPGGSASQPVVHFFIHHFLF